MSTDLPTTSTGERGRNDRMAVQYRPIDKLWQPDTAPRRYPKADIARARSIIRKFGVRLPLLRAMIGEVITDLNA